MEDYAIAIVVSIVGLLGALLTPVVVWLLNQRGEARQTRELDRLLKRTELLEKLRSLQSPAAADTEEQDQTLDAEYQDILEDLSLHAEAESSAAEVVIPEGSSGWRRFWLDYEMKPGRPRVYRVIYYVFFVFAIVLPLMMLLNLPETSDVSSGELTKGQMVYVSIFNFAFYGVLGWLFRRAAIKQHQRQIRKEQAGKS
jgi:hypothetical protein